MSTVVIQLKKNFSRDSSVLHGTCFDIIYTYCIASLIGLYFIDIKNLMDAQILNFNFFIHFLVVCSAMSIGTSIYIIASAKMGPVKSSTFIFSVPFIAMLTASVVLGESIGINIIIGGLLSIASAGIVNYRKKIL